MNSVQILGRLVSDPELRQTQGGIASCRFTIAVDRPFKNKQTGEKESDSISCQAWRNTLVFISQYWSQGKLIAITGSLRTGSYKDKKHDDITHYTTDVVVDQAYFCGDKGSQPTAQGMIQQAKAAGVETKADYGNLSDYEEILSDEEVPF